MKTNQVERVALGAALAVLLGLACKGFPGGSVTVTIPPVPPCGGAPPAASSPSPLLAAASLTTTPGELATNTAGLPPWATPDPLHFVGKLTSKSGGPGKFDPPQLATDIDVSVDPNTTPSHHYVAAVHWNILVGGQRTNTIAVLDCGDDGLAWGEAKVVFTPAMFGTWGAQGIETPSLQPPSPGGASVWTMSGTAYGTVDGFLQSVQGRYSSLWFAASADWAQGWALVSNGPCAGPVPTWTTPFKDSTGKLAGGLQEAAHWWVTPQNVVEYFATNSYHADGGPRIGLALGWDIPGFCAPGQSLLVLPDPVAQVPAPNWISHPDLVIDPRDGSQHIFAAYHDDALGANNGTSIVHLWATDWRHFTLTGTMIAVEPGTDWAGVVFGPSAVLERLPDGSWRWRVWISNRPGKTAGPWLFSMWEGVA